jgi:hypothetical protein
MITEKDQLKNRSNFIVDGKLYLVRCMACPNGGDRGVENYMMAVANGTCAWCGWNNKENNEKDAT